jgi:hypothetical protein
LLAKFSSTLVKDGKASRSLSPLPRGGRWDCSQGQAPRLRRELAGTTPSLSSSARMSGLPARLRHLWGRAPPRGGWGRWFAAPPVGVELPSRRLRRRIGAPRGSRSLRHGRWRQRYERRCRSPTSVYLDSIASTLSTPTPSPTSPKYHPLLSGPEQSSPRAVPVGKPQNRIISSSSF